MPFKSAEEKRAYQREWVARRRAAFFADKTCEWCRSARDLELHHRDPAQKVAHAIWSWTETRRLAEIAKCIVLCRDCHSNAHRETWGVEAALRHPCGTIQSYWRGCRCIGCRAARREYGEAA